MLGVTGMVTERENALVRAHLYTERAKERLVSELEDRLKDTARTETQRQKG